MRCPLWKINNLDKDKFTDRMLVIADNAEGCPAELKRFAARRKTGNAAWFALIPDFSDQVEGLMPRWLVERILLGNVSLVFAIDGNEPEMDVAVAVSVIHFVARRCVGALDTFERSEVFPWAPVPFGVSTSNLVVGSQRNVLQTNRKSVLWHAGHSKQTWERHFEELDEAWSRHLVATCARLHTGCGGTPLAESEQACLFLALYPFLMLTPWAAPEARAKLSEVLRNRMRPPGVGERTYGPWDALEKRVRDRAPQFECDLENSIAEWIAEDGVDACLVGRIAEYAEEKFPELFDGWKPDDLLGPVLIPDQCNRNFDILDARCGSVFLDVCSLLDISSLRCKEPPKKPLSFRSEWPRVPCALPSVFSPGERLLTAIRWDRCLGNTIIAEAQRRRMPRWHLADEIQRGSCADSRWTLRRGCHWLRNVIGPDPVRTRYIPGGDLERDHSSFSIHVHATDSQGKGMAAFSLAMPAVLAGSEDVFVHVLPCGLREQDPGVLAESVAAVEGVDAKELAKQIMSSAKGSSKDGGGAAGEGKKTAEYSPEQIEESKAWWKRLEFVLEEDTTEPPPVPLELSVHISPSENETGKTYLLARDERENGGDKKRLLAYGFRDGRKKLKLDETKQWKMLKRIAQTPGRNTLSREEAQHFSREAYSSLRKSLLQALEGGPCEDVEHWPWHVKWRAAAKEAVLSKNNGQESRVCLFRVRLKQDNYER